jgi:hypothetical protein
MLDITSETSYIALEVMNNHLQSRGGETKEREVPGGDGKKTSFSKATVDMLQKHFKVLSGQHHDNSMSRGSRVSPRRLQVKQREKEEEEASRKDRKILDEGGWSKLVDRMSNEVTKKYFNSMMAEQDEVAKEVMISFLHTTSFSF